ncbi:hypothetical protein Tco_0499842 [Tanacetum coccineum]
MDVTSKISWMKLKPSRYHQYIRCDKKDTRSGGLFWAWYQKRDNCAEYVSRCLNASVLQIKAEHQKPSGFLQQPEIPEWKWEKITMDFVTKLPKSSMGMILCGVVVDKIDQSLTSSLYVKTTNRENSKDKLYNRAIRELKARHGVSVSKHF